MLILAFRAMVKEFIKSIGIIIQKIMKGEMPMLKEIIHFGDAANLGDISTEVVGRSDNISCSMNRAEA